MVQAYNEQKKLMKLRGGGLARRTGAVSLLRFEKACPPRSGEGDDAERRLRT